MTNKGKIWIRLVCLMTVISVVVTTVALALIPPGHNSLEVRPCDNADWQADFATASPTIEVIKVATATQKAGYEAFDYDFDAAGFVGVSVPDNPSEEDWQVAANQLSGMVTEQTPRETVTGLTAANLDDGMYLILVHGMGNSLAYGSGLGASLYVDTPEWRYGFTPALVVLPGQPVDGSTTWQRDVSVTMKPTRSRRQGSIRIDKTVLGAAEDEATFVFDIIGRDRNDAIVWHESRSLTTPPGTAEGLSASLIVDGIPTGLSISVTEAYPGAGYTLMDAIVPEDSVTSAESQPTFVFTNMRTSEKIVGGSISNKFVYDEDGTRDWTWHASPSDKAEEGQS